MNILLVNDDGINSDLLKIAFNRLSNYGNVTVVAPKEEQSGKSISITIGDIPFEQIDKNWYAVDGTPADCVTFALYGLRIEPDIVVSGVNKGYNIGVDTMYSGTVGAAKQACYHGYKAISLSGDYLGNVNVKRDFDLVMNYVFSNNLLSKRHILNVNFQQEKFEKHLGIKVTKLHFVKTELFGEIEDKVFKGVREVIKEDLPQDCDVYAYKHGYISISRIKLY